MYRLVLHIPIDITVTAYQNSHSDLVRNLPHTAPHMDQPMPCTLRLRQSLAWLNLPKGKDSMVLTFDATNDDIATQMVARVLHYGLALE
jgi:hypothetical protein